MARGLVSELDGNMQHFTVLKPQSGIGRPAERKTPAISATGLLVMVPYTTPELTAAALQRASQFGCGLRVQVALVGVNVVPFPCPLNQPLVDANHLKRQLLTAAAGAGTPVCIKLVYTRDRLTGYRRVLESGSLVLIATRRRWWRTREENLARGLSRAGHNVIVIPV